MDIHAWIIVHRGPWTIVHAWTIIVHAIYNCPESKIVHKLSIVWTISGQFVSYGQLSILWTIVHSMDNNYHAWTIVYGPLWIIVHVHVHHVHVQCTLYTLYIVHFHSFELLSAPPCSLLPFSKGLKAPRWCFPQQLKRYACVACLSSSYRYFHIIEALHQKRLGGNQTFVLPHYIC